MIRRLYIVNATQVVTSEAHPEGLFSVVSGFPQYFDSRNYQNNTEAALRAAKAAYYARLSANYAANNRVMTTVTLMRADGRLELCETEGGFPEIEEVENE